MKKKKVVIIAIILFILICIPVCFFIFKNDKNKNNHKIKLTEYYGINTNNIVEIKYNKNKKGNIIPFSSNLDYVINEYITSLDTLYIMEDKEVQIGFNNNSNVCLIDGVGNSYTISFNEDSKCVFINGKYYELNNFDLFMSLNEKLK